MLNNGGQLRTPLLSGEYQHIRRRQAKTIREPEKGISSQMLLGAGLPRCYPAGETLFWASLAILRWKSEIIDPGVWPPSSLRANLALSVHHRAIAHLCSDLIDCFIHSCDPVCATDSTTSLAIETDNMGLSSRQSPKSIDTGSLGILNDVLFI